MPPKTDGKGSSQQRPQEMVAQMRAAGTSVAAIRQDLRAKGYKKARISQLLRGTEEVKPDADAAAVDDEREDDCVVPAVMPCPRHCGKECKMHQSWHQFMDAGRAQGGAARWPRTPDVPAGAPELPAPAARDGDGRVRRRLAGKQPPQQDVQETSWI